MPQNWKTYKLGELADVIDSLHKTPKYSDTGYRMVRAQEIVGGVLKLENAALVNESVYNDFSKNHKSKIGDLVFSRVGAHSGKVSYVATDTPFCLGQNTAFIIPQMIDSKLLYYFLSSPIVSEQIERNAIVSSYKTISLKTLRELEITIPESLPEQRAIASILSSLDDKIELNLQMNKTLEEMAMTLYKHWFVDFEFPVNSPPLEGSAQQGVVNSPPLEGWIQPKAEDGVVRNTTNYMSLPYNPKLKERAKALRKAGNLAEVLFWQQVNKKQFMGLDFDRQKIIGNYIVDFYCANVNVVVEIDGSSHDNKQDYDAARDAYLEGLGLTVIHITDEAVKKDLAQTMEDLKAHSAFNSPPPEGWSKTGVVNSPPPEGWISSEMKDGVVLSRHQQESPQGEVNSPPLEESPQGEVVNNHPAFQAPLQGRGRGSAEVKGYKSSGGKFIDSELGPIPEGWEVKRLGEVVSVNSNSIKKNNEPSEINYIDIASVNEGWVADVQHLSYADAPSRAKRIVSDGDIVWSTVRPNRKSRFLAFGMGENTIASTGFAVLTPNRLPYSYIYPYSCTEEFVGYLVSRATGSSYPAVTGKIFEEAKVLLPPDEIVNAYDELCQPFFVQYSLNSIENQTLTALRDTLLPKLISGEVRVKDVESQVAEVL